jgi:hypothetical protein
MGAQVWIALTTALTAAYATFLQYRQTSETLLRYNQTRTDLKNVRDWWYALTPVEKLDLENVRKLVSVTEKLLASEQTGWVQEMQDTLAELREQQAETADAGAQQAVAGTPS